MLLRLLCVLCVCVCVSVFIGFSSKGLVSEAGIVVGHVCFIALCGVLRWYFVP